MMETLINCQCGARRLVVALTSVRLFYCARCRTMVCPPHIREQVRAELEALAIIGNDRTIRRWIVELDAQADLAQAA